jgi:hypothetical protein
MATAEGLDLSVLYEQDETAWLEAMFPAQNARSLDDLLTEPEPPDRGA